MLDDILRWLGYGLCHQLAERSFFGLGHQVPICARDTGIYVGFAISLVVIALLSRGRRPSEVPPTWLLVVGGFLFATMAVDGLTSYAGIRETTNALRLITGLAAGYSLTLVLAPILNGQVWSAPSAERVLGRLRDATVWLLSIPVVFAVVYWALPWLGIVYPLLVAAAILGTFTAVVLAMVCLFPAFENKARRLREAWLAIAIAFAGGIGVIAAAGAFRAGVERLAGVR